MVCWPFPFVSRFGGRRCALAPVLPPSYGCHEIVSLLFYHDDVIRLISSIIFATRSMIVMLDTRIARYMTFCAGTVAGARRQCWHCIIVTAIVAPATAIAYWRQVLWLLLLSRLAFCTFRHCIFSSSAPFCEEGQHRYGNIQYLSI